VVVITAGRQEERVRHTEHDVKSEDVDVEVMYAVDIRGLQVDVADVHAGSNRPRASLAR
jgi:hypothetical protein